MVAAAMRTEGILTGPSYLCGRFRIRMVSHVSQHLDVAITETSSACVFVHQFFKQRLRLAAARLEAV